MYPPPEIELAGGFSIFGLKFLNPILELPPKSGGNRSMN
jgi:hypothetical protein